MVFQAQQIYIMVEWSPHIPAYSQNQYTVGLTKEDRLSGSISETVRRTEMMKAQRQTPGGASETTRNREEGGLTYDK